MTIPLRKSGLTRRALLARTAASVATVAVGANFICAADAAWALEVAALKPETMATLMVMARDIYPHDRLGDQYYAAAMKGYDTAEVNAFREGLPDTFLGVSEHQYARGAHGHGAGTGTGTHEDIQTLHGADHLAPTRARSACGRWRSCFDSCP